MILERLQEIACKKPDKVAIIYRQKRVTYGELHERVLRLASFLINCKVTVGSRVCMMIENSPEYIISYFAIQKAGGISVALNPHSSAHEIKWVFSNCLPVILIIDRNFLKIAIEAIDGKTSLKSVITVNSLNVGVSSAISNKKEWLLCDMKSFTLESIFESKDTVKSYPSIDRDDIASIIYTSGTTGRPKGVTLTHGNFVTNADSIIKYLSLTMNDSIMVVLPFYYSYGTSLLTTHIIVGGMLVLENSFMYPNVILDKLVSENITGFAGVPSTFAILLNREFQVFQ